MIHSFNSRNKSERLCMHSYRQVWNLIMFNASDLFCTDSYLQILLFTNCNYFLMLNFSFYHSFLFNSIKKLFLLHYTRQIPKCLAHEFFVREWMHHRRTRSDIMPFYYSTKDKTARFHRSSVDKMCYFITLLSPYYYVIKLHVFDLEQNRYYGIVNRAHFFLYSLETSHLIANYVHLSLFKFLHFT